MHKLHHMLWSKLAWKIYNCCYIILIVLAIYSTINTQLLFVFFFFSVYLAFILPPHIPSRFFSPFALNMFGKSIMIACCFQQALRTLTSTGSWSLQHFLKPSVPPQFHLILQHPCQPFSSALMIPVCFETHHE